MNDFRAYAGDLSFREMERRCGRLRSHSTLHRVLTGDRMPTQVEVKAVNLGCGGTEEDVSRYVSAWRQIRLPDRVAAQLTPQPAAPSTPGGNRHRAGVRGRAGRPRMAYGAARLHRRHARNRQAMAWHAPIVLRASQRLSVAHPAAIEAPRKVIPLTAKDNISDTRSHRHRR